MLKWIKYYIVRFWPSHKKAVSAYNEDTLYMVKQVYNLKPGDKFNKHEFIEFRNVVKLSILLRNNTEELYKISFYRKADLKRILDPNDIAYIQINKERIIQYVSFQKPDIRINLEVTNPAPNACKCR